MTLFELRTTQREYDRDSENLILLNQVCRGGGSALRRNAAILAVVGAALTAWVLYRWYTAAAALFPALLFPLLPLAAAAWLAVDLPTRRERRAYQKRLEQNAGEPDTPIVITFGEEGYAFSRAGRGDIAVDYGDIRRLIETEDFFFLTDEAKKGVSRCMCLNKARFTDGEPEELRSFIEDVAQIKTELFHIRQAKPAGETEENKR